ncbi:MAG TPA: molecular chaperone DnaJ [Rhodocyclaceae bacterium]|nr:molecular chaperone DnaJ [Rhodocyclaceae bacterium]
MPLFSPNGKPPPSSVVVVQSATPLSKDQKAFNTLIEKIESARRQLADWNAAIASFKQKYASDLHPLYEQERDCEFRLAQALDASFDQKGVTKGEKRKLSVLITELVESSLGGADHEEAKTLYNRHSQSDFDAEEAAEAEQMKSMMEGMLGMDLGEDVDMSSMEDVLNRMQAELMAQQEAKQAKAATRKKSARQLEKEAQREAEEKHMSQSIREVYRKLASSLHPDREPDPDERQRKTDLMQRVNEAHKKGDLLGLLELQLQLEQIDHAHLATLGPERLKYYIKILKEQLKELNMETEYVEAEFASQFGMSPFQRLAPQSLMPMLQHDIANSAARIQHLQEQLEEASDLKRLKAWLKTITLRRQTAHDDFDMMF